MGPVIVAIIANAVSSVFSGLALRRSGQNLTLAEQTAQRAEERYQADRIEARKRQLIDALVDVSYRVNGFTTVNAQYAAALNLHAVRMPDMTGENLWDSAMALLNVDMEKQRPALAEAHRALQVATLLFTDTTDVLSEEKSALFDYQLDLVGKAVLNVQKAVQAVKPDIPQSFTDAITEMRQLRQQVSDGVGDLIKLGAVIIAAPGRPPAGESGDDGPHPIEP